MWTGNLSVGIEGFDEDHKRLIQMLNELHRAAERQDASGKMDCEEIEIALHRLENYTKYHCTQEEYVMAETGYPDLESHQAEHKKLIAMIADMEARFRGSTSPAHAEELMQVIYGWIINHVNLTDKKYSGYLNARGVF